MRSVDLGEVWDARPADRGFMTALATLAFTSLGLELVFTGTALTATGEISEYYPLPWQITFWVGLGFAWMAVARALVGWSRRRGVDPLPPATEQPLGHNTWSWILGCFVSAVLATIVIPVLGPEPWRIAPVRVYLDLYGLHGPIAWLPLVAWAIHHVGQAALTASFIAYAHRAVLLGPSAAWLRWVPCGGLIAGAAHGAVAYLTGGPAVALATLVGVILLGVIHVLSQESLRITMGFAVLILIFL